MPQKEKFTREIDFRQRAAILGFQRLVVAANINMDGANVRSYSGAYIFANNSSQRITFHLPAVASANGFIYYLFDANTGGVHLTTINANTIICPPISVNATHGIRTVNISPSRTPGVGVQVFGAGNYFYVLGLTTTNTLPGPTEA